MARISVSVHIAADPSAVWEEVATIEDHVEWMADAHRIEFLGPARRGVGTRIRVETRIGPFRTADIMEFTEWSEPTAMGVEHRGLFTGSGRFVIDAEPPGTRFTWTEELRFPWYLGGAAGALAARPVLTWVWRRNLRRLAGRVSDR